MTANVSPQSPDQPLKGWAAFEHRVAQSAEYLLILTFVVIFWMAGFVDLFTHTSEPKVVLGLYSWPFAIVLLVYAAGFLLWGMFLFHPIGLDRFKGAVAYIQAHSWLGILIMFAFAGLIASMYVLGERWIRLPLLQIAVLLMILLFTGVLLFANPVEGVKMQPWRKGVIGLLAVVISLEVLLQVGALLRILPFENLNGLFTPYGRIYTSEEGGSSGQTNANGWYYPNFRLKEGSERYALVGGSYLLGLQVAPNQNMGIVLDRLMNTDKEHPREVVSMGTPDYGLEVFLHERMFQYTAGIVNPEEVIVVFHALNDFQALEAPNGVVPFAQFNADGVVDVPESEYILRHDLWHTVIRGYDPPNPAQTIQSYLFMADLLGGFLSRTTGQHAYVPDGYSNTDYVTADRPFAGLESLYTEGSTDPRAEEILRITTAQLESWRAVAEAAGVEMRLVILPYFPASFYSANSGDSWSSELDTYDLFTPERLLQDYAVEHDISVLPLGQYLQAAGLSVEEIRSLYFQSGIGHFTPQGHQTVADAIYGCFYAGQPASNSAFAAVDCRGE